MVNGAATRPPWCNLGVLPHGVITLCIAACMHQCESTLTRGDVYVKCSSSIVDFRFVII